MIRRRLLLSVDESTGSDECSDPVVHSNFDSDSGGEGGRTPPRHASGLDSSGFFSRTYASSDLEDFDSPSGFTDEIERCDEDLNKTMPISPSLKLNELGPKLLPFIETPPYRQVRALRLVESPQTPKTLLWRSKVSTEMQPKIKSRLFPPPQNKKENDEKLEVNVNPFTPTGISQQRQLSNKRRRKTTFSLSKSPNESFLGDELDDSDDDIVPPKKLHMHDSIGSTTSRYEKEFHEVCQIGTGEFGSVYKCIHRLDGCTYAIKKSRKPLRGGTSEERAALNEVCAHAVVGAHPHIVRYHSAWAEEGHMVIQSEYCNGGSLADAIKRNAATNSHFPESELKRILMHVAEGLAHFHFLNLAHLDIKPGNIFISRREVAVQDPVADDGFEDDELDNIYKIGDLGHVTSLEAPQVEEGDCRYLPLEILQEEYGGYLDRADVFSLALTVVEAAGASGPLPKNGPQWCEIREEGILPPLPPYVSESMRKLLTAMIHPDPAQRPSARSILSHPTLSPLSHRTKDQLRRALRAERLKNERLEKKLWEARRSCLPALQEHEQNTSTPEQPVRFKFVRSHSNHF